jgi:nucleoside-diphosphate-sugar epimerase
VQREMEGVKGPVCVIGGTGFIGSWFIMRLLDHGYSVRTTVRSAHQVIFSIIFFFNGRFILLIFCSETFGIS